FKRELMHASAVGKSMLATLDEAHVRDLLARAGMPRKTAHTITEPDVLLEDLAAVTRQGYALDDEEDVDGVFCVASPVVDHRARCAGAIGVTGLRLDLPDSRLHELGRATQACARRASELLGAPRTAVAS